MFLLSGAGVLEPHLRHSLTEACQLRDPLQVLAVRVGVDLEIGLKHLQLLVREGGPHPLTLPLTALTVCVLCAAEGTNVSFVYICLSFYFSV